MDEDLAKGEDTNVRVAVRCRPFNTKEKANGETSCVRISTDHLVLVNPNGSGEEHNFAFDLIFDQNSRQQSLWESIGDPILLKAFSGYNGTIFAYGQTGSGKTWSMQGAEGNEGIIPRMNNALFAKIGVEKSAHPSLLFLVTVSYFEIYNEVIFDLLDPSDRKKHKQAGSKGGLEIKEHPVLGVYVKGLQEIVVDNPSKLQEIIDQGMSNRTVASTQMNADSSRSHSVFQITLHQKDAEDETKNVFAKVNLVDLAGSERVKSTGASGATLKEGANINKSLSELGNVINALVEQAKGKRAFVPYRNSKLTRVLQESLGGNSITAMLAALSPAACNFEETLSTLKYANRAKAIKVNAVKNEEASQISRLNEEIRVLREKLLSQNPQTSVDRVDTTEIEERHRQQLRELEEAMKSTWEDKSRVSEQHEEERKRLELEQRKSARQLEAAKERHWKMLEDKNDVDLSIMHVKEISKRDEFTSILSSWQLALKELTKLEQRVGEQFTVVQVYRTALDKDCSTLLKPLSPRFAAGSLLSVPFDKASISSWRQLRDKLTGTRSEVMNWIELQESLRVGVGSFYSEICMKFAEFQSRVDGGLQLEGGMSSEEFMEVFRGIRLLKLQAKSKLQTAEAGISRTRENVLNLKTIGDGLVQYLNRYESVISDSSNSKQDDVADMSRERGALVNKIRECVELLGSALENQLLRPSISEPLVSQNSSGSAGNSFAPLKSSEYKVECSGSSAVVASQQLKSGNFLMHLHSAADVILHCPSGEFCWAHNYASAKDGYIEFVLHRPQAVTGIILESFSDSSKMAEEVSSQQENSILKTILPCGISLTSTTTEVVDTCRALSDVINWTALLKKNSPDKFLARPPVRFLFDLIKFVGESVGGTLLPQVLSGADWELVSASKQSKIDFMEQALQFVSNCLKSAPLTNANSIVTGAEAGLTNQFLQQLAIVAFHFKNAQLPDVPRADVSVSTPATVRVCLSLDGENWIWDNLVPTNLSSENQITTIDFLKFPGNVPGEVRYIRIIPPEKPPENQSDIIAIKVNLLSESGPETADSDVVTLKQQETSSTSIALIVALDSLLEGALAIINAIEFLVMIEDARKQRRQEEARKQMEGLANEKLALEQMLAHEKQALTNEKQDLSDQLKMALSQLQEVQSLLAREQTVKIQLQLNYDMLDAEKEELLSSLQEKSDEMAVLKNQLLKLQANVEKDRVLVDTLQTRVQEQDVMVSHLQGQLQEGEQRKLQLEQEKDEFLHQVSVLTEERDTARSSEETLFGQLLESSQDLERLQESYVDMTDRYNDAQDEISDLREQLNSFRESLNDRIHTEVKVAKKTVEVSHSPSKRGGSSSKSSTASAVAQEVSRPVEVKPVLSTPVLPVPPGAHSKDVDPGDPKEGSSKPGGEGTYDDDFDGYEEEFEEEM